MIIIVIHAEFILLELRQEEDFLDINPMSMNLRKYGMESSLAVGSIQLFVKPLRSTKVKKVRNVLLTSSAGDNRFYRQPASTVLFSR